MWEELEIRTIRLLTHKIQAKYAYDLSEYAQTSLKNGILNFAHSKKLTHADALMEQVITNRSYFMELLQHLVVPETEFFRDPAFWRAFKSKVVPRLQAFHKLKIWLPFASDGKELWTLLIALKESGLLGKCEIWVNSISEHRLSEAKAGIYHVAAAELFRGNYQRYEGTASLEAYLQEQSPRLQFNTDLLGNVAFVHNAFPVSDGLKPFHFILCRNAMLYFNHSLQERVQNVMSDALEKKGLLAIGIREQLIGRSIHSDMQPFYPDEGLYQKTTDFKG